MWRQRFLPLPLGEVAVRSTDGEGEAERIKPVLYISGAMAFSTTPIA